MKAGFTADTAVNNKVEGSGSKLNSGGVGYFFGSLSCQHLVCVFLFFFVFPPSIRRNGHGKQENAFQNRASGDLFPAISTFLYGS